MHARKYLQSGLGARVWKQADFVRASGLTRQRVPQMLSDDRDALPSVPRRGTLRAIASAFRVSESTVTVAFQAMGYDLGVVRGRRTYSLPPMSSRPPAWIEQCNASRPQNESRSRCVGRGELDPEKLGVAARRTGQQPRGQQLAA